MGIRKHQFARRWWVCAGCYAALLCIVLACRYRDFVYDEPEGRLWTVHDDVYISACFARSLVSGHGFVWYEGAPRVEGITNPLWSVMLGALHWLPGFTELRLGAFVIALNALLLCLVAWLFYSALARATAHIEGAGAWAPATVALALGSISLAVTSALGFEVALAALLALIMFGLALREPGSRGALTIGLLCGLGFATRMDFAWLSLPTWLVLLSQRRTKTWALALACALGGVAAIELARFAYFGDWFPNTYYLKTTQWPLRDRLQHGWEQNRNVLIVAAAVWLPLLPPSVRAGLRGRLSPIVGAWLCLTATAAYSTALGGDFLRLQAGYDRHTAAGALFLVWGLSAFVLSLRAPRRTRVLALLWALGLAWWPLLGTAAERDKLFATLVLPTSATRWEENWYRFGVTLREVSLPGARVAVCPAGAIVYFSHRGGVDLLGKVEPYVAHLPVTTRRKPGQQCWRNWPGHNKADDAGVFDLRKPEFARAKPTGKYKKQYVSVKFKGQRFFALEGTPFARWDLLR